MARNCYYRWVLGISFYSKWPPSWIFTKNVSPPLMFKLLVFLGRIGEALNESVQKISD
jgi:hypothetical protein